jgi:hypothetical protein
MTLTNQIQAMTEINYTIYNDLNRVESVIDLITKRIRSSREREGVIRSTQIQIMDGEDYIPLPPPFPELELESEENIINLCDDSNSEIIQGTNLNEMFNEEAQEADEADEEAADEEAADEEAADEEAADEEEADEEETEEAKEKRKAEIALLEEECHRVICKEVITFPEGINLCECSICLDIIQTNANSTTTRCGHTFHTSCFLKAIDTGTEGNCPNCRTILVVKESDDDDDDDDYDSESESSESEESEGESESEGEELLASETVTLEQTANKLQEMGYTSADILTFYLGKTIRSENAEKYNHEFFVKMNDDLDNILNGTIPL